MEESTASYKAWPRLDWSVAGLWIAGAAVGVQFGLLAGASLSYDEATYVELAQHPWRSSFYPDAWFVRHPPAYFVFLWFWTGLFGASEIAVRFPSLLLSLGALAAVWDALRRTATAAAAGVGALILGASFLVGTYGLQATMYPLAFAAIASGAWAHTTRRSSWERIGLIVACLTHYIGYVYLAAFLLRSRNRREDLAAVSPALAFLPAAGLGAFVVGNPAGPGWGPGWQLLRAFSLLYEATLDPGQIVRHVGIFALILLLLNPVLLRALWSSRRDWTPWAWAAAVLVALILPGPGFLRYALLVLPVVAVVATPRLFAAPRPRRAVAAALALALVSLIFSSTYIRSSMDPSAGNDVPGSVDWSSVANLVARQNPTTALTPAPPALAYYLVHENGFRIIDAAHGPGRLALRDSAGRLWTLLEAPDPEALREGAAPGTLLVVPTRWNLDDDPLPVAAERCGGADGAEILGMPGPEGNACRPPE